MILTAVLMVKNEGHAIDDTLMPLVHAGIKDIFILDTGSEDNTVEKSKQFFKKHNLNGHVAQEAFVDFATSRNRAIELASDYFKETTFFLMLDAEWQLKNGEALIPFCEKERSTDTRLYLIRIKMGTLDFTTARLMRAKNCVRFVGAVHEVPDIPTFTKVPDPVHFEVKASHHGVEKSRKRWQRDAELLLKSYQKNPNDPRTAFYLAQTYHCLGDLHQSLRFYKIRENLPGWDEENYVTLFRLGCLSQEMQHWENAMAYYLKAFGMRPSRIEPLVKIADYYWPNNIPSCYLFIRHAYNAPYPKNDILFIEKEMYEYTRYEIMSRCAWYVNEFKLGEEATLKALKARPETPHLKDNLKLYQGKLVLG